MNTIARGTGDMGSRRMRAAIGRWTLEPIWHLMHASGFCSTILMLRGPESLRWHIGRIGMWLRHVSAMARVPAYRAFVHARVVGGGSNPRAGDGIPATDKVSYVSAYPMAERCLDGVIPRRGVVIDESSGSSGLPTNWVRGARERDANARTIRRGLEYRFGKDPKFMINAFALGPWATGINLTMALSSWTCIKNLGPDIAKIANALKHFGPSHHYLIMGYPPFLKQLVDQAGIDWNAYTVSFVYGGEGMSESMRRYLQARGIARVYGSYGASDLDLNLAAETDFTIALRRIIEARPEIATRLVRCNGATPMLFQFNPADFFMESSAEGELLVTVCRPGYIAPKVRYNIHDLGHVMRFPEVCAVLAEFGIDVSSLDANALDLPVLFHYGRSDMSVAWYGCKIPPADIQETLFRTPALAGIIDGFQLQAFEDRDGDKQLVVALELHRDLSPSTLDDWSRLFFETLAVVNQDFRESRRIAPARKSPRLDFHAQGTGPFDGVDVRIKRQYVAIGA